MKIDFILSDTTKGATTATLKTIAKNAESDIFGSHIVIVPETKSIIIEKELLNLSSRGSFANVYVYSFVRLLDRLGGFDPEKFVGKQACVMLLRKIIYDNISKLSCYKKTAKTIGFAEKMYETIAQLKSSEVSAKDLELAMQSERGSLKVKLADIILIYSEYEKALGNELYDDFGRLSLLSDFSKNSELIHDSDIYIVGFDNITTEMQRVLKDLAANAKSIIFSSVYFNENRKDRHIQNNELYFKFKHIADELRFPYVPKFVKDFKSADFYNIQNYAFSSEKHIAETKGNVFFFEARTKKQECDFVASQIISLVREGKRFKDIGVLINNAEADLPVVKQSFELYKIPYFANSGEVISSHFFVRFISFAFEVCLSHFSAEKVLKFISSPLFACNDFSELFNYVSETGTNYLEFMKEPDEKYIEKYRTYYEKAKSDESENNCEFLEKLSVLQADLLKFREFFADFNKKLQNAKFAADYILALKFLFEKFDAKLKLNEIAVSEREQNLLVDAEITDCIFAKIEKFCLQLDAFLGQTEFSADEFLGVFLSGLSAAKINIAPVSVDCVVVQENTDGFYDIKDLFIVGASDGEFPKKINDSGIILDGELEQAKQIIGKKIEPSAKDINRRENFRVYESLLEPTEKLFISYSQKSESGKNNKVARIVLKLIEIFGEEIKIKSYTADSFVNYDILEKKFANEVNEFLNDKINLLDVNKTYEKIYGNLSKPFNEYLNSLEFSEPKFENDFVKQLYFSGEKTSISQLQTYFDCPYKFFALYGLRLKESKDSKLNLPDIGTIIHRVVELFGKDIKKYAMLSEKELEAQVNKLVCIATEENGFNATKNKALILSLNKECVRLAKYILYEQSCSNFKLAETEYVFGGDKAICLNVLGDKTIKLEGKIDRIDSFGDFVRIIDYKTGSVKNDLALVFRGQKIQLAAYLQAVSAEGKKIAGVFYFPVHSDYAESEKDLIKNYKLSGFILDDIDVVKNMDSSLSEENTQSSIVPVTIKFNSKTGEISFGGRGARYSDAQLKNFSDYVKVLCETACNEILSGYIEPSPVADAGGGDEPQSCKTCKLSGFCGLSKARFSLGRISGKKVDELSFELGGENGNN